DLLSDFYSPFSISRDVLSHGQSLRDRLDEQLSEVVNEAETMIMTGATMVSTMTRWRILYERAQPPQTAGSRRVDVKPTTSSPISQFVAEARDGVYEVTRKDILTVALQMRGSSLCGSVIFTGTPGRMESQ
ncbi:hypothetical protein FOL46_004174, partial [Perkinsus olseni]